MQATVRAFFPKQSLLIVCLMALFVGLGGRSWGQATENFSNLPMINSSSYAVRSWTGTNNVTWTADGARTDQTLNGSAICFGTSGTRAVYSPTYSGGIGTLTFNYVGGFTGTGARSLGVFVNGVQRGSDITVSSTSNTAVAYSSNINITGNLTLEIRSTGSAQVIIDDINWTAYSSSSSPPTLTAASNPTVDAPFNITFTDNSSWRSAITGITIGGTALTAGYSISAGSIIFTPSASAPANLLETSGSKSIVITANGYFDATVTQALGFGAANKLVIGTQPTAPASNGLALGTQPVINIADQYGNTVTTSTATVTATKGAGTWTLGGTASVSATSGVTTYNGLTATSTVAVTGATIIFSSTGLTSITSNTFNIPTPAPALTATPTTLNFGSTGVGNSSASQSVSISGMNLTGAPGNITISSPSNQYQLSTDNISFGTANVTIPYSSATLAATNVWVRLSPTTSGTKNFTLNIYGGGVTQANATTVSLQGTAVSIPVVSSASVSGTYSTVLNYNISATNSPTSYAIASGTLPAGLSLNTSTGVISGTPAVTVTGAQVGVTATNVAGTSATATLTFNIAPRPLMFTGLTGGSKVYDGNTTAPITGTATLVTTNIVAGDNVTLSGTPTGNFDKPSVAATKAITITGLTLTGPDASKYILTQPSVNGSVIRKPVTITGVTANDKVYNGLIGTTLSGTPVLNGVVGTDDVSISGTPTANFDNANAGTNKPVTVTRYSLAGTAAGNYTLVQPTGLTANITKANQTIAFPALPTKTTADPDFDPGATASSGLTITYTSSNPGVATIVNGEIHTVGAGTSTITASQAGNGNYNAAQSISQTLTVTQGVFENFEGAQKTGYATAPIELKSGQWIFENTLNGFQAFDSKNGLYAPRIQATGSIYMNFDFPRGAQSVSVLSADFSDDGSATWQLEASTDGGTTWTLVGEGAPTTTSLVKTEFTNLAFTGNVRFKIKKTGGGQRANFDDFDIIAQNVGTPVFATGLATTRCAASETITYSATAANTIGITYSLDAASLSAGNTIDPATGAVTYVSTWSGASVITASATGVNGPKAATFTITTSTAPIITTQPVAPSTTVYNSTNNAATLTVAASGTPTYQWQYYNGTSWQNVGAQVPTGFTYSGAATSTLTINTGAQPSVYSYRALVSNGNCSTPSNAVDITVTAAQAPTVITLPVTAVTTTGATLGVEVTASNGSNIIAKGVYYGDESGTTDFQTIQPGNTTGVYSTPVTGLSVNTQYFYYGYAAANLTGYGSEISFYTLALAPGVPVTGTATATSVQVTLSPNAGNPSYTPYSIRLTTGGNSLYLQASGALGTTELQQTAAEWGANPITATGLIPGSSYTIDSRGFNGDGVPTAWSSAATATTLNNPLIALYRTRANGTFTGSGTWEYNSTGYTYTPTATPPSSTNAIEVRHELTLNTSFSSGTSFTITTGSMYISPNAVFGSIAGTVNFGGRPVTVISTTGGTGSIGNMASEILNATAVTVERFTEASLNQGVPRRAWRLVTSPVMGQTIRQAWQENGVNTNTYGTLITGEGLSSGEASTNGFDYIANTANHTSIKEYTNGAWVQLATNSTTGTKIDLHTREGYMLFVRGDRGVTSGASSATLRATGMLQQGDIPTAIGAGTYTLIGNPYASTIDFGSVIGHSNNATAIRNQFYIWKSSQNTYGSYVLVRRSTTNPANYETVPQLGNVTAQNTYRYIPSSSAFFVFRNSGGIVTISESDKSAGNKPTISPFKVIPNASNVHELYVNLNIKNDTASVLADGFVADFSADYEGSEEDNSSVKAENFNENLGLIRNDINHIVEARGEVKKTDTLQLKMWNLSYRNYEFQMKGDNFTTAPGIKAWLEDSYLQTKQAVDLTGNA